ncbi:MAG TPA: amidohydrolase family protein, partial [Candidatus Sulfotelmatobacter sp.]|nr:amidohydrolase family protein [Candidatus Sulfotelmatobacter sp.]
MRTITLEEHYASPAFLEGAGRKLKDQAVRFGARAAGLLEQLCDLGDRRLADMDAAGIDVQVLSLTSPGAEQLDATEAVALAREANDFLADAVRRYPSRFLGLAALPTMVPECAADELERTVRDCGFKGAVINGH